MYTNLRLRRAHEYWSTLPGDSSTLLTLYLFCVLQIETNFTRRASFSGLYKGRALIDRSNGDLTFAAKNPPPIVAWLVWFDELCEVKNE